MGHGTPLALPVDLGAARDPALRTLSYPGIRQRPAV